MFNSTTKREGTPGAATASSNPAKRGAFSVLGSDVTVTGHIAASADLHIDGRVEGDVSCATLVQGAESVIVGAVSAEVARLAGAIEGSVRVRELQVDRSAQIAGDVEYEVLTIEPGARVEGKLRHKSPNTIAVGTVTNVTPIAKAADGEEQHRLLG